MAITMGEGMITLTTAKCRDGAVFLRLILPGMSMRRVATRDETILSRAGSCHALRVSASITLSSESPTADSRGSLSLLDAAKMFAKSSRRYTTSLCQCHCMFFGDLDICVSSHCQLSNLCRTCTVACRPIHRLLLDSRSLDLMEPRCSA